MQQLPVQAQVRDPTSNKKNHAPGNDGVWVMYWLFELESALESGTVEGSPTGQFYLEYNAVAIKVARADTSLPVQSKRK